MLSTVEHVINLLSLWEHCGDLTAKYPHIVGQTIPHRTSCNTGTRHSIENSWVLNGQLHSQMLQWSNAFMLIPQGGG